MRFLRKAKTLIASIIIASLVLLLYITSTIDWSSSKPNVFNSSDRSGRPNRLSGPLLKIFEEFASSSYLGSWKNYGEGGETDGYLWERLEPYLDAWLNRPILSALDAVKQNSLACPIELEEQSSADQIKSFGATWDQLSSESISQIREELADSIREFFNTSKTANLYSNRRNSSEKNENLEKLKNSSKNTIKRMEGQKLLGDGKRGIVVTAGNKDTATRLLVMLRILRKRYHSTLPVEIFVFPDEISRVQKHKTELKALGAITVHKLPYQKIEGAWKNFHIKGVSILHSSFTEVLYLDSDNIPLTDPSFLFDSQIFKQFGIVLWPDISKDGPRNPIWRISGTNCIPQDWQIDSGQVLLNKKSQHGLILCSILISSIMQFKSELWFKISNGDKDTFRYSLYILQIPWTRAPNWLSTLGSFDQEDMSEEVFCGHTMFQYSLSRDDWAHYKFNSLGKYSYPSMINSKILNNQNYNAKDKNKQEGGRLKDDDIKSNQVTGIKDEGFDHPPPLFAHINLLKYSGNRFGKQAFRVLKTFKPNDEVSKAQLNLMNLIRAKVNDSIGLCVDYKLIENFKYKLIEKLKNTDQIEETPDNDGFVYKTLESKRLIDLLKEEKIKISSSYFQSAWNGLFKDFERTYWEEGGL